MFRGLSGFVRLPPCPIYFKHLCFICVKENYSCKINKKLEAMKYWTLGKNNNHLTFHITSQEKRSRWHKRPSSCTSSAGNVQYLSWTWLTCKATTAIHTNSYRYTFLYIYLIAWIKETILSGWMGEIVHFIVNVVIFY